MIPHHLFEEGLLFLYSFFAGHLPGIINFPLMKGKEKKLKSKREEKKSVTIVLLTKP